MKTPGLCLIRSSFDLGRGQAVPLHASLITGRQGSLMEVHPVSCYPSVGPQTICVTTPVACHQEAAGRAKVEVLSARKASLGREGLKTDNPASWSWFSQHSEHVIFFVLLRVKKAFLVSPHGIDTI